MDSPARRALTGDQADLLRQIPSVDELLAQPRLAALAQRVDRELLVEITRTVLADLRGRITGEGTAAVMALDSSVLEERIASMVERVLASSLEPVINATGVILHTNLGRAPLIIAAAEEVRRSATSYSNLEYDLEEGARGKRDVHVGQLLERLTGAEAAIVVNNCAAAVLLVLAALAKGGEVIVSRGELIEIGDGFRIPEIMAQGGAVLREVGTTNRTHIVDYENAINENTRLLLRVHPSNFTITGFTEKPSMEELVALGRRVGLPLVEDLGSGCLVDLSSAGITEPTVRQSVEAAEHHDRNTGLHTLPDRRLRNPRTRKIDEAARAQVLDQRQTHAPAERDEFFHRRLFREAGNREVRRMHAQQQPRVLIDRVFVIDYVRAIRSPDFSKHRSALRHDLRDAEAVADFNQFAPRDDYLSAFRQRR